MSGVTLGRGYGEFRDKAGQYNKYIMSCFNCDYYYQAVGDSEDLCQNPDVLEYDMVNTESTIYCLRWKPVKGTKSEINKSGFRSGVSIRGRKKKVTKTGKKSRKRARR